VRDASSGVCQAGHGHEFLASMLSMKNPFEHGQRRSQSQYAMQDTILFESWAKSCCISSDYIKVNGPNCSCDE